MVSKSKRYLLMVAVALGVSMGMSASNTVNAAVDMFLKIEGDYDNDRDAPPKPPSNLNVKAYSDDEIVQVVSYEIGSTTYTVKYAGVIRDNQLLVKKLDGWWYVVIEGRFGLSDGSTVVVENGQIVKRTNVLM